MRYLHRHRIDPTRLVFSVIALCTWSILIGPRSVLAQTGSMAPRGYLPLLMRNYASGAPAATTTPSATPTWTAMHTATRTAKATAYPSATPTATATATAYSSATATATATATPTATEVISPTTAPPQGIYGRVTQSGQPAPGLALQLRFWNGVAWSTQMSTTTGGDGGYAFVGAPTLGPSQVYYVRYLNTPENPNPGPGYLWSWAAAPIASYVTGQAVPGGDFDVADIALQSPVDGATVGLPASFCWQPRNVPSDNYRLVVYSPILGESFASDLVGNAPCATVTALPSGWPSGASYRWWVRVYQGQNPDLNTFGTAYGEREAIISR